MFGAALYLFHVLSKMEVSALKTPKTEDIKFGCDHYDRKSKFVTPCCDKVYYCRFCHDDNESHTLDRKAVTEILCCGCGTRQKVQQKCENCSLSFGKYTCLKCRLFDDKDRKQYHCEGCGLCRIGGQENFFHCYTCNMCLPKAIQETHRCIENVSRGNCPICMEDLHTSRTPCHIPACSHLIHEKCFEQMISNAIFYCPVCQTSLTDLSQLWEYFDKEVANTPMPEDLQGKTINILCRDCHKNSSVSFHIIGHKCPECGSYNTCC